MAAAGQRAASEPAEVDARALETSLRRVAASNAQQIARAQVSQRFDRVTASPGIVPARGAWESLIGHAYAEQAHVVVGDRDRAFDYSDPGDLQHENETLGTHTTSVASHRPTR
jgi:hypothetical protein